MPPANIANAEMFGESAPIWTLLEQFDGPVDPFGPMTRTCVYETHPGLALMRSAGCCQIHVPGGGYQKYNPTRKKTFGISDWHYVCIALLRAIGERNLAEIVGWTDRASRNSSPQKVIKIACVCSLRFIFLKAKTALTTGNCLFAYNVVPHGAEVHEYLYTSCSQARPTPARWVKVF